MKIKFNNIIIYLSLLIFIGVGLVSCGNKQEEPPIETNSDTNIYIESFDYEVVENESSVENELAYTLSFDIEVRLDKTATIRDFVVGITGKRNFTFTIDYCNTEKVMLSQSENLYPFALLEYSIPKEKEVFKSSTKIKISTKDLIDDINKFLKIDCYNEQEIRVIDTNSLTDEEGHFKMNYSSDTGFFYEYNEFSESYKIVSIITKSKSLVIPSRYNNHPVDAIDETAFVDVIELEELIIPTSITSLPRGVLGEMTQLKSLTISFVGASLNEIEHTHFGFIFGASAYSDNYNYVPNSLKEVIITGGTSIGNYAFSGCSSLTSITIPDSVTSIGESAFSNCSNLTSITIPNSVTSIGYQTFSNCSSLASIAIPNSVTSIDSSAFSNCSSLTSIAIPNSVTSIGYQTFSNCSSLTSIAIPISVTSIGSSVFSGCSSLTRVAIPDSVTSIDSSAFSGCSSLTSVTIPNSVTSIGYQTFSNCSSLTSVTIPFIGATLNGTENTHFGYIFGAGSYNDNSTYVPKSLKEVTITGGTSIVSYAFYKCSSLTSITIPEGVTSIGKSAFSNCSRLTSVTIPDSVTSIDSSAFFRCSNLTNITIPNSVTSIDSFAFDECSSLTNVAIPDSVTSIAYAAFRGCSSLTSVTIPNSVTSIGSSVFSGCSSLTSVAIPDSVTSIDSSAFSGCSNLTSVTIPFIGERNGGLNAHFGYIFGASSYSNNSTHVPKSLKEVIITRGKNIGNYAFSGCSSLTNITIPNSVTSIGNYAFSRCSSLTNITIPNSVTSIGGWVFEGCTNLTSISIPNSVTSIRDYAFSSCSSLTSIAIPDSVTSIGGWVFYGCSNLTSVTIPGSVTSIGWDAFRNCSSLTSITIGNSVTSIEIYAFSGCSSLTSITIPDSVTSIGESAFSNCSNLTSITIPNSVTRIGGWVFEGCSNLTDVYYEGTIEDWEKLSMGDNNSELASATIYYYSETRPTEEGNYWHYVDGVVTKW